MRDGPIEEIYALVQAAFLAGQKSVRIDIFPFVPVPDQVTRFRDHKWFHFWEDLWVGYRYFENQRKVPHFTIAGGRYLVAPL